MIDIARATFAQSEYRKTAALINPALQALDPLATELEFKTLLSNEEDALVFRQEIMDLRQLGRNDWKLDVKKDAYFINIGDTITVEYPRFGFDTGKNFIVKAKKIDRTTAFESYTLYGPQ